MELFKRAQEVLVDACNYCAFIIRFFNCLCSRKRCWPIYLYFVLNEARFNKNHSNFVGAVFGFHGCSFVCSSRYYQCLFPLCRHRLHRPRIVSSILSQWHNCQSLAKIWRSYELGNVENYFDFAILPFSFPYIFTLSLIQ